VYLQGCLWALVAGYAARLVPDHLKGRAIAIAMAGTPIALSLGIPAGTLSGCGFRLARDFWSYERV
jgi:predicted MFS family arabinose efflux permease